MQFRLSFNGSCSRQHRLALDILSLFALPPHIRVLHHIHHEALVPQLHMVISACVSASKSIKKEWGLYSKQLFNPCDKPLCLGIMRGLSAFLNLARFHSSSSYIEPSSGLYVGSYIAAYAAYSTAAAYSRLDASIGHSPFAHAAGHPASSSSHSRTPQQRVCGIYILCSCSF